MQYILKIRKQKLQRANKYNNNNKTRYTNPNTQTHTVVVVIMIAMHSLVIDLI